METLWSGVALAIWALTRHAFHLASWPTRPYRHSHANPLRVRQWVQPLAMTCLTIKSPSKLLPDVEVLALHRTLLVHQSVAMRLAAVAAGGVAASPAAILPPPTRLLHNGDDRPHKVSTHSSNAHSLHLRYAQLHSKTACRRCPHPCGRHHKPRQLF